MSAPRYRAWQFSHPDLHQESIGLSLTPRGGVAMLEDRDSIKQAILLLLSTVPGERVMRPTYGCHLHRLVFSPNDGTTAGLAIHYVRRAIDLWEPRIDILHLDASPAPEAPEQLMISLTYRVRVTQQQDTLAFSFNLTGGN